MRCPCGSEKFFDLCCGPYISGAADPPTALALMRSRYVAYTRADIDYIARTTAPESLKNLDARAAKEWATKAKWLGLQVLGTEKGGAGDSVGEVEFVATHRLNGDTIRHHELSRFRRTELGQWRFVDGDARSPNAHGRGGSPDERPPALTGAAQKVGRNDPCPCGSGRKFKKCCGAAAGAIGAD
jgi:SEC-C motif domain protein